MDRKVAEPPSWRFRMLGDLEVERDGERLTLSAQKLRVLLVMLLLHTDRVVPFTALEAALWPARPPESTRGAIHTYVMRLRRALGPGVPIHTRATGYAIEIPPTAVDVAEFRIHLDEARAARATGAAGAEHAALTAALALWRGPVLRDLPLESVPEDIVRFLDEQRLDAVVRRAVLDTDAGRHDDAVTGLRPVTAAHPLRGEVWEVLMLALQRAGRVAEALDAYREVRQKFRDELGLDPDERLQQLHRAALVADRPTEPAQDDETVTQIPRQLPMIPGGFTGRTAEVRALADQLSRGGAPVVVVSGPPGVGKTALIISVAHRIRVGYPDGQLHADLRGYSHDEPLLPQVVLTRFLRDLGVPAKRVPSELDDQANLFRSLVADQQVLVVLDNAASPEQVRPLLPGAAGCAVVVSSRDDLRGLAVDGGRHTRLRPLNEQDARAVLANALGAEVLDEAPAEAGQLVQACAGLPLALRIASANLAANPHMRLADYLDVLRSTGRLDRFRVPGDEQLAVRAAFDLSHDRLPAAIAARFRLLGLLPGPNFGIQAAAALMDTDEITARGTLDHLAAANLIVAIGPSRYQLHELIREYLADKVAEHADTTAAERLWDHYLTHAYAAADLLYAGRSRLPSPGGATFADEATALDWLDTERPNLVAAVRTAADSGIPAHAARLLDAMRGYVWLRGAPAEILALCEVAAAAARAVGDHAAEASAIDLMGLAHFGASRFERATEHHVRALVISRTCGDLAGQTDSLHNIGRSNAQTMPPATARRYFHEAFEIAERTGDLAAQARNMNYIGASYHSSGEFAEAREWLQRAMALSRRTGNMSVINSALGNLGNVEWSVGNLHAATELFTEAAAVAERLGNLSVQAITRIALAEVLCDTGDFDRALHEADRGAALSVQIGDIRHQISGMEVAATAAFRRGDSGDVERSYLDALRTAREISFVYGEVSTTIALSVVHRHHNRPEKAVELVKSALDRMTETGVHDLEAHALVQLGHAYRVGGDRAAAARTARQALEVACARGSRLVQARALHLVGLVDPPAAAQDRVAALLKDVGAGSPDVVPEPGRQSAQPANSAGHRRMTPWLGSVPDR